MEWLPNIFDIVDVVTMIAAAIAVIIAYCKLTSINNAQYSETLASTIRSLHNIYDTEGKLETKNDCELYAVKLLDTMSFLAHLNLEKKADEKMLDFLKYDFAVAKRVMVWFDDHKLGKKYGGNSRTIWRNLEKYCKNHGIDPVDYDVLPVALMEFENLDVQVFVYGKLLDDAALACVIGRPVPTRPAVLLGYEKSDAVRIDGIKYYAAAPDPTKSLDGKIITLSQKEVGKLDEWETNAYKRIKTQIDYQTVWIYVKNK